MAIIRCKESDNFFSGPQLRDLLKWPRPLPLEEERVRLLHEVHHFSLPCFFGPHCSFSSVFLSDCIFQVGKVLEKRFGGKAANLVEACGKSAMTLVSLIAQNFPGTFLITILRRFSLTCESARQNDDSENSLVGVQWIGRQLYNAKRHFILGRKIMSSCHLIRRQLTFSILKKCKWNVNEPDNIWTPQCRFIYTHTHTPNTHINCKANVI